MISAIACSVECPFLKPNWHSFYKILCFSTKDNSCLQTNFSNIWLMDERFKYCKVASGLYFLRKLKCSKVVCKELV